MAKTRTTLQPVTQTTEKKINYTFWIYHAIVTGAVLFLLFIYLFKNDKIVYVDSARILNEYKATAEAKKAFESKAKVWQDNIDTLTNQMKNSVGAYEKSLATMSPKEQNLSKQLIQSKQKQLSDYQRSVQDNAKQEESKLTQGIVSEINSFLSAYGKKHNYKMILIANASGTIAYARDGLDITTEVIDELNNEYQEKSK
jgi:outer membrane protein